MSVEAEIREKLLQGYLPQQLVQEGYSKSTVYRVFGTTKAQFLPITQKAWSVLNAAFLGGRYQPGYPVQVGFTFRNDSPVDLYVHRIGVRAEWMLNDWYSQEVKELVKSGGQRWIYFTLPLPEDLKLGEYEFLFGLEGQYLPSTQSQPLQIEWSNPCFLEVKKPKRGLKIFLSHSTKDMRLVRQLQSNLDNEGIDVLIGEYKIEPGVALSEKFQRMIRDCNLVLALLTVDGARSKFVLDELGYAHQINKRIILLKEDTVMLDPPDIEYVKFSKNSPPEILLQKVTESVNAVSTGSDAGPLAAILAVGLIAFLAGLALGDN